MPKEKIEWKELKKIIIRERNPLDKLRSLDKKSLKNIHNKHGKNILHVSIKHNISKVTRYLINFIECDVNKSNQKNGCTPLSMALQQDYSTHASSIKLLLEKGADISWKNVTLKQTNKIQFRSKEILKEFRVYLKKNYKNTTAKFLISKGWPLDGIATLQDSRLTQQAINEIPGLKQQYEAFIIATVNTIEDQNLNLKRIQLFLQDLSRYKIIMALALNKIVQLVDKLTGPSIVKMLLSSGAPIEDIPGHCESPLILAVVNYNLHAAWMLLDGGCQLNSKSREIISKLWIQKRKKPKFSLSFKRNVSNLKKLLRLMEHPAWRNLSPDNNYGFYSIVLENYFLNFSNGWKKTPDALAPIIEWMAFLQLNQITKLNHFQKACHNYIQFHCNSHYNLCYKHSKKCDEEILKMKEFKADNVSVYDIFVKPIDAMITYTRNENTMEKLKSMLNVENFIVYCEILRFKLKKANDKKLMVDRSIDILSDCLPKIGSSLIVIEKIVHYMGSSNKLC